jgi:hypothetical protein
LVEDATGVVLKGNSQMDASAVATSSDESSVSSNASKAQIVKAQATPLPPLNLRLAEDGKTGGGVDPR